jgi:predicted RNA-binding Zn-ribbon protein involved in translation (DUF1610 family)
MGTFLKLGIFLGLIFFVSCGNLQMKKAQKNINYVIKNCYSLKGKEITLTATYKGWHCPSNCSHPGITRSDTCWVDKTGCIYSKGFGGLSPFKDINKIYRIRAVVNITKKGVCYLEIKEVKKEK